MKLAAVILAGGRGERLGGTVKANIEIGGTRLLKRVGRALGTLPSTVLVAYGANPPEALGLLPGHIAVPDLLSDYAGPLAGVAGAVAWCLAANDPPEALLSVAVDTPFVPATYAERMLEALGDADVVVAAHGGQLYPTNAIWRVAALADLPADILGGTAPRSLKRLAEELEAGQLDWPESDGGDPFASLNTPADLAALEARARASWPSRRSP